MLVSVDQLRESVERYLTPETPKTFEPPVAAAMGDTLEAVIGAGTQSSPKPEVLSTEENLEKRKEMLKTEAPEPVDFAYERAIGKNDSVYSNFIELISDAKKKVARIVIKRSSKILGYATGFMVSERLMLTNWHVFNAIDDVEDSEVEFGYELDVFGRAGRPVVFKLKAADFFHSKRDLDYCILAVDDTDVSGKYHLSDIGYIFLNPGVGKLGEQGVESLNIIHHPAGDYKQLSIRENKFTKILPATLWYESDTAQGSSGSPVFNDQWQVVALHHMGVPSMTEDRKSYLDKDGKIIQPVDGKVDIARIHWIANEGIRISVILKDLYTEYPDSPYVNGMKKPASGESPMPVSAPTREEQSKIYTQPQAEPFNTRSDVRISFPASLVQQNGSVTITVHADRSHPDDQAASLQIAANDNELTEEIRKADTEQAMDFSDCEGYVEDFLGVTIPMPRPKAALKKFIAKLADGRNDVLKYHHYSVMHHTIRRVPVVSAINVDGDMNKRKDKSERKDVWLRDKRIDLEVQLDDKYYSTSGFDKGHMSRREDANWADTAELAKKYADFTCFYTNACPQVPELNRSNKSGLWGQLEKIILEKGAKKENGGTAKIVVFNGPIFSDTDRIFKGVQVPMEYWKIVIWYNPQNKLRATAFKLSQAGFTDDIDFEELALDTEFKEYQCSIRSLDQATGLNLSYLYKYDTFNPATPAPVVKIPSEEALLEMVAGM